MITDDIIKLDKLAELVEELQNSDNCNYIAIAFHGTPEFVDAATMIFEAIKQGREGVGE